MRSYRIYYNLRVYQIIILGPQVVKDKTCLKLGGNEEYTKGYVLESLFPLEL